MLHAKFEEKPIKYAGDYSTQNIRDFITENALPSVTEMNHDNAQKLFKSPNDGKSHLLVFHNKSLDTFDAEFKMLSRVGREFKDKVEIELLVLTCGVQKGVLRACQHKDLKG